MKKKVLFLIPTLMGGGAERVLVNLVNALDKDRFDVTLMCVFNVGVNRESLGADVRYRFVFKELFRGNSRIFAMRTPAALHRAFIKEHYDIEIAFLEGVAARIVSGCEDPAAKKICWIHTSVKETPVFAAGFRSVREAKDCYARFDRVVCVSEGVRADFENKTGRAADVLYNPIDGKSIAAKSGERAEFPIDDGLFPVCAVGKLDAVKGFDRLAYICKRLKNEGVPAHFYILGEGGERERLERLASQCGVEERFTLTGFLENPYAVMSKCGAFVCSSHREGFSSVAAEAMFCRLPVVTVDVPGMRELLGDDGGLICPNADDKLYDALKTVLTDEEYRNRLAENGFRRAARFDQSAAMPAIEEYLWES